MSEQTETNGGEYSDGLTPEEANSMQAYAEAHRYDGVDPFEELDRFFGSVEEAKGWLDDATGALMQADGGSEGMKQMQTSIEALRVALAAAHAAVLCIEADEYLAAQMRSHQEDKNRAEDQHDAQSW